MAGPSERAFETAICESLMSSGGYSAVKVGNAADRDDDFSPDLALDTAELFSFIGATQAEEWEKVRRSHSSPDEAQRAFATRLSKELDSRGTVDVLRHGIVYAGHEKAEIRLAYFRPASGLNADLEAKYQANRLTVTRQLPYEPSSRRPSTSGCSSTASRSRRPRSRTTLTGQTVEHAKRQYRTRPRPAQCAPARRAVVHFAVDTEQVVMTTRLSGDSTRFLPFNRGDGDRARATRRTPTGYRTALPVGGGVAARRLAGPAGPVRACRAPPTKRVKAGSTHLPPLPPVGRRAAAWTPTPARRAPGTTIWCSTRPGRASRTRSPGWPTGCRRCTTPTTARCSTRSS